MNTLLWKEFRETLKWGATLLAISFVFQLGSQFMHPEELILSSSDSDFEGYLALGCAVTAVVMGLLQTFREISRDRWAFLMHRAVTPQQVLWSKAAVGIGMYLIGWIIPLIILSLWSATPGNVAAPWHWMAPLRPLLLILYFIPLWFVGALISVRDARWYGTRLMVFGLPVILAVSCVGLLALHGIWGLVGSLALTLLSVACMVVLTRNAFEWRGQSEQLRTPARCVLALNAGLSFMLTLLATLGFGLELSRQVWMTAPEVTTRTTILEDGSVEEVTVKQLTQKIIGKKVDGREVTLPPTYEPELSSWRKYPEWIAHGDLFGRHPKLPFPMALLNSPLDDGIWHYSPEQGVFLGFNRKTRRHVVTVSPEGFLLPYQVPQQRFGTMVAANFDYEDNYLEFAIREKNKPAMLGQPGLALRSISVYAFHEGIYHIDQHARTVRKIYAAPPDNPLVGARFTRTTPYVQHVYSEDRVPDRKAPGLVQVVHQKTVRQFVINADDEKRIMNEPLGEKFFDPLEQQTYVIPEPFPGGDYWLFLGFRKSDRCVYSMTQSRNDRNLTRLIYAGADGTVRRDVAVEQPVQDEAFQFLQWLMPPGGVATVLIGASQSEFRFPGVTTEDFSPQKTLAISTTLQMICVGVLSAICALVLCVDRRISGLAAAAWIVFGGLMGVSGLMALVGICPRPLNVTCHACHKRRPVDQGLCPHCQADFESPPQNGTEIIVREPEPLPIAVG